MKIHMKLNRDLLWVIAISAVTLLVHLLTYNNLGFHRDELLYLALGQHISTGYWSNPPMIGLISYLSQLLPGDPLFTTRLFPAIAGAILVLLTGLMARELGGKLYAQVLACVSISLSLLILRGYSMLQPVPFDILCWTLILFWFLRYINTRKPLYLLLIGVIFGLGMLNKYMMVFLAAGFFVAILFTSYRRLWINKYTWYAILIALLLFLPNLIWQYNHGFPVVRHMQELKQTQLVNVRRANILLDQLLMFTIGSLIWIAGLIYLLFNRKKRISGFLDLFILLYWQFFLFFAGKAIIWPAYIPLCFQQGAFPGERFLKTPWWKITVMGIGCLLFTSPCSGWNSP